MYLANIWFILQLDAHRLVIPGPLYSLSGEIHPFTLLKESARENELKYFVILWHKVAQFLIQLNGVVNLDSQVHWAPG